MDRITNKLIIALFSLTICVPFNTACGSKKNVEQQQLTIATERQPITATLNQGAQKLQLSIPKDEWVTAFFNSLEKHTKEINLPSLRTDVFSQRDDLEMRFWADALPNGLQGVIMRRINNQWSAISIMGRHDHGKFPLFRKTLGVPKSGWNVAWKRLVDAEILTLPDGSETNCNVIAIDGITFVIETSYEWSYRTYAYGNPQSAKCNEAKKIISIVSILFDEFSLETVKF